MTDLPPFSGDDSLCRKCGEQGATTRWVPRGFFGVHGARGECLERACRRCDYAWAEATVEQKPAVKTTS